MPTARWPPDRLIRYLAAKKTVDDRALNQQVWNRLAESLPEATADRPLRVLEIGAGIGSQARRLIERDVLTWAEYTLVDIEPACLAEAERRLVAAAAASGFTATRAAEARVDLTRTDRRIQLEFLTADLHDLVAEWEGRSRWDLLIAQAVLDEIDLTALLPRLLDCLAPGGLGYFSINFDGATIWEPVVDADLDARIDRLYNASMDVRTGPAGLDRPSQTGRRLLGHLVRSSEVLAAGGSDWVVFAGPAGYPRQEAHFLRVLIDVFEEVLTGHPDLVAGELTHWLSTRRGQIDRGELILIAHHLDALCRVGGPAA